MKEMHIEYGPCDSLGPGGECAECKKIKFMRQAEQRWLAWLSSDVEEGS